MRSQSEESIIYLVEKTQFADFTGVPIVRLHLSHFGEGDVNILIALALTVGAVVGRPMTVKKKFLNDDDIIPIRIGRITILHSN